MDLQAALFSALFPLTLFLLYKSLLNLRNLISKSHSIPKPSGSWPILGHLPLLATTKTPPFRTLAAMADRHGPIFLVKLGMKPVVVVSSWEIFKECFTVNDKQLASRPAFAQGKYIGNDFSVFALAPHGPYWREMRKIAVRELLSPTKLAELRHIRVSELNVFIKKLYLSSLSSNKIVLNEWISVLVINMVTRLISRRSYGYNVAQSEEAKRIQRNIKEFMFTAGQFLLFDAIPMSSREWLDPQGLIRRMKRVTKDIDEVIGCWIDEHRWGEGATEQDFIDVMISLGDKGKLESSQFDVDTMIKGTIKTIFLGASDSTSLTLTWMMSLLLNHCHIMKRAKEEMDQVVGKGRWVVDSDIEKLTYLQAIVKETLRLYPPGPLLAPRAAAQDCIVVGHQMRKGDQLLFNVWKVHRDPRKWADPDKFIPERFLEDKRLGFGVTRGDEFWYIPFGAGRRSCPGSWMAFDMLHLTIARLIQGFEVSTLVEPVDMVEGLSINLSKAAPLEMVLTPRLSLEFYG